MSGIKPLFTSAPRIKIKLNGQDIAFAVGLSTNISVELRPVQVLGKFGAVSIEPTMYNIVSGTMQIVKLNNKDAINPAITGVAGANLKKSLTTDGNGNEVPSSLADAVSEESSNSIASYSNILTHLDPTKVLVSESFDIQIYMKVPDSTGELIELPWFSIYDVRLASRNTNISMGQLVNEPVNFQGLWASPFDENGKSLFDPDFGVNS